MKTTLFIILSCFCLTTFADVYVHGYTRRDGTYVQPHMRSDPDHNVYDNWSTKGNVNPYTGQEGTRNPDNEYNNYSNANSDNQYSSNNLQNN